MTDSIKRARGLLQEAREEPSPDKALGGAILVADAALDHIEALKGPQWVPVPPLGLCKNAHDESEKKFEEAINGPD